jgi:hypothetical protein
MNEQQIQQNIRLSMSEMGFKIFRNNCGAYKDSTGRLVRYGLANPGGSDLIGFKPTVITPEMVGKTVAIFTAIEVKTPTGKPTPEQLHFVQRVKDLGGIAGIARSVDDVIAITNPIL